jgi:hypothetical protein
VNPAINQLDPASPQLVIKNLPLGTTEAALAEWLWSTLGLNIPAEHISCLDAGTMSAQAFVHISRDVMAEFFTRYLCDQYLDGRLLKVEPKTPRRQQRLSLSQRAGIAARTNP